MTTEQELAAARKLIRALLEWEGIMGGWESAVWTRAKAYARKHPEARP